MPKTFLATVHKETPPPLKPDNTRDMVFSSGSILHFYSLPREGLALSPICPQCEGRNARRTVASQVGAYYRCNECGHIWHLDTADRSSRDAFRQMHQARRRPL